MVGGLRPGTGHFGIYTERRSQYSSTGSRIDAEAYPIAKVLQSPPGASAVTAIWSMVLAETCSEVAGSNKMMVPWEFPKRGHVSRPVLTV